MTTRAACVFAIASMLVNACSETETKTYKLYFLAGQSNMVGYGYVNELPNDLKQAVDHVMIFDGRAALDDEWQGGTGVWAPLQPGFGNGFKTDGRSISLSDRFGPELSFGQTMSAMQPDTGIALVKYALGGSGLAPGVGLGSWHPTDRNGHEVNQFDHAAGIIWMQGESDANDSRESADAYDKNLAHLVRSLRAALRSPDLPVVIGKITDSGKAEDGLVMDYIDIVQKAQASFSDSDRCAELVSVTENLNYRDDEYHYDTEGFIRLGEAFAKAALRLENTCSESVRLVEASARVE
jgi:hypothetical protein